MGHHIAFLRAVNVGRRQVRMADLRAWLTDSGYRDVETYIQTGNVRVGHDGGPVEVCAALEALLLERAGFEVPAVVLSPVELADAHARALGYGLSAQRQYVTFLKEPLEPSRADELAGWDVPGEQVRVDGRVVHWWLDKSSHEAKLSNARIERGGGCGTTRDLKVVAALAERWAG